MKFLDIIRWSTFASTLLMAAFGYSDQLRLIIKNHSTAGLSFVMILLSVWTWGSYMLYGWLIGDRKIFWPNLVGTAIVGAILVSFFVF
ncbi:MAG: hypothetical protein HYS44_01450 [Candidatus Niyogibacteria bacterium]|nr:hypothetical protein [Candidatus Niyogibacteria bacterium]